MTLETLDLSAWREAYTNCWLQCYLTRKKVVGKVVSLAQNAFVEGK